MPVTINGTTGIAGPDGSASTPAVQGTDSNTGLFYPAADTVALSTGGTERMRITSAGNVGIGTSSPDQSLVVQGQQRILSSTPSFTASGKGLELYYLSTDDTARIQSYDRGTSAWRGLVLNASTLTLNSAGASDYLGFNTQAAERMRITSGGNLLVGTTTNNASGGVIQVSNGITFPATQSASSDANTLDDYEEGTWTPNVGGTATYTTQTASYTKIGNTVVVWGEITINLIGTGSTTRVYGLPFTSNGSYVQPGSTGYFANLAQSVYSMTTAVEPGTTNLVFHTQTSLSGTNNINQAVLGNSARIQFSVTYKV